MAGDRQRVGRPRPKFTAAERNELLADLRLTPEQIAALERALGEVSDWIAPQPRSNDVWGELRLMADELAAADLRLASWRSAQGGRELSAKAEALGHFNIAAAPFVRGQGSGLDLGDNHDPATIITVVARLAHAAAQMAPRSRRTPMRAAAEAIRSVVRALGQPTDAKSKAAAERLTPRRSEGRSDDFMRVAQLVWSAVLGPKTRATPDRAIRAYCQSDSRSKGAK